MERIYKLLYNTVNAIQLPVPDDAYSLCIEYIQRLSSWNQRTNLVGKHTPYDIASDLCIDSIYLAHVLSHYTSDIEHIVDCGAGAGIPGIPLRCFYRNGTYTMIECREKRVLFLESVLRVLSLPQTRCCAGRVENICGTLPIDAVVSRAFMPPTTLLPFFSTLLHEGVYCICMLHTATLDDPRYVVCESYEYVVHSGKRYIVVLRKV